MNRVAKMSLVGVAVMLLMGVTVALALAEGFRADGAPPGRIAFCTDRDGNYDLYVMDAKGDNQAPLKSGGGWNWNPDWSPDGTQVAYFVGGAGVADVYVRDLASQTDTRLTSTGNAASPRWSPDGTSIAFNTLVQNNADIHVMKLDENLDVIETVRLTDSSAEDNSPMWAPTGSQIAFNSDRSGYWDIWVMDVFPCPGQLLCAGEPHNVTNDTATEYGFDWSPDGTRLAVASTRGGYKSEIYIFDLGDRSWLQMTSDGWYDMGASWAPDGKWIAYSKEVRGGEIYVVNVETTVELTLTVNSAWDAGPDWWGPTVLEATVDIKPNVLNLKSKGRWVTAYIELPQGYDVADIDVGTVLLEDSLPAAPRPTAVGDYDQDGVPDLMVKFRRQPLIAYLKANGLTSWKVELTVTGYVDGIAFEGDDIIRLRKRWRPRAARR